LSINFVFIIASNKSSICQEISSALQHVIQTFPNRYSSLKQNIGADNTDNSDNNNKNKKNTCSEEYSMVVSNVTEIALLLNLSKINTILLHSDGDVALNKLGYYEQGKNETSAGISLFCEASDGIRGGFIRATGVSQIKMNREIALFSMFVASTGSKMAYTLQRFHESRTQDGVCGRVFYTWCSSVPELPETKSKSFTNIASFAHFAISAAYLFVNQFQFRYSAAKSDFEENIIQSRYLINIKINSTGFLYRF
jgi:hypothetical protein